MPAEQPAHALEALAADSGEYRPAAQGVHRDDPDRPVDVE